MRLLLATLTLALLAACGGQAPAAEPLGSPTSAVDDPAEVAGQSAIEAYNGFWIAVAEAGAIPDASYAALSHHATDDALEKVKGMILGYEAVGHYTEGQVITNPQITEVVPPDEPTEVSIVDCMDTRDSWVYDKATGEPTNDVSGGFREVKAIVQLIDGHWLVTAFGAGKVGSCEDTT